MDSGIVCHLQDVEGDPVDRGLAQGVQPGDVGARIVDLLHGSCHLSVVVVLKLHGGHGRGDHGGEEDGQGPEVGDHLVANCGKGSKQLRQPSVSVRS